MSVFDEYEKGSFRGVPFLYVDSDGELGRRKVVHEYPGRDLPFIEDLGRRTRVWSLEIMVAGSDYMGWRDRLTAALDAPGPGILVHPTLGQLKVEVLSARGPRESTRRGGTARFFVLFGAAGDARYPADSADGRRVVEEKSQAATQALAGQLKDRLDVAGRPSFIGADAVAQVEAMAGAIHRAVTGLPELAAATGLMEDLNALTQSAASLVRDPIDLVQSLTTIWGDIVTAAERPLLALSALKSFFSFSGSNGTVPLATPNRVVQSENRSALSDAFAAGATIAAARVASAADYDSQQAADAERLAISDQIDTVCLTAADALYDALCGLRAALIADLGNRPGLPAIRRITLPADLPALVLAHRLYGGAARDADIVARNGIAHPGFVPGGRELEVLSV